MLLLDLVNGLLDLLGHYGVEPAVRGPKRWLFGVGRGGNPGDVRDLLRMFEEAGASSSPGGRNKAQLFLELTEFLEFNCIFRSCD